jgi:hypothetical protein
MHAIRFAARGTFHIEDRHDAGRHALSWPMAAGLEQHFVPALEQALHQRIHVRLKQRLAAGNLHQRTSILLDTGHDLFQRHLHTAREGIGCIAPAASKIAGGEPDDTQGRPT